MWEWNVKSQFFKTKLASDLASRLDWVASSSCELTKWPVWTFCPIVLQLAWWFSFSTCFTRVHPLVACQSQATREIQLRVPASVHNLEHFFTLSHTLPLHDSHLNIGFLSAELQANWHWIKPTKWLIKFNLTEKNFDNPINEKSFSLSSWIKATSIPKYQNYFRLVSFSLFFFVLFR